MINCYGYDLDIIINNMVHNMTRHHLNMSYYDAIKYDPRIQVKTERMLQSFYKVEEALDELETQLEETANDA